jgi:hypothetical protein
MWFIRNFGYFFLVPGVLMLLGAAWLAHNAWSFRQAAKRAEGTVIANRFQAGDEGGGAYHPEVEFRTPDGQTHRFLSGNGSSHASFQVGERVPLIYDEDTPEKASIDTFSEQYLGAIIVSILGTVFSLVGGIPVYLGLRKRRLADWVKRNGQAVEAQITGVHLRANIEVNGRNPYRITAQWTDSRASQVREFKSENLWFDPAPYMPSSESIRVLIDPNNPTRYWMDTSFLPKQ